MDCYDKILQTYNKKDNIGTDSLKIWRAKALIKLMAMLKDNREDNLKIKNCMILLINLLFDIDSPDYCTELGMNKTRLSQGQMEELKSLLKKELDA